MIEQVTTQIYRIKVPIPENPMGATNSYVVKGRDRSLMIDAGFYHPESMAAMTAALSQLGVDPARTDFFITHMHLDHFGLVSDLAGEGARVYLNRPEMGRLNLAKRRDDFLAFAGFHGFSDREIAMAFRKSRSFESSLRPDLDLNVVGEDDVIDVEDMHFRCIETAGHTRGHLCLFEPSLRIFLAGDHILPTISPVLEFVDVAGWDPLRQYMASLDKVRALDIGLVLPGHGRPFRGHRERIDDLKVHHERRLKEVVSLLGGGQKTAIELAPLMTWNIRYDSWDLFPLFERMIAVGETVAHLTYLEEEGEVRKQVVKDRIMYSLESVHEDGTS